MATVNYTDLIGLALPTTGDLSGQWGTEVNDYISKYVDAAVAGTQTISGSQTAVTLSKTTGTALVSAGSGATGSSQYQIINCTGNPAGLLTITAPAASKPYIILNSTSTSQSVKIVGAGPTTGVTLISGEKAIVAWNGSDFVKVASTVITNLTGTLGVANGGTGLTSGTSGGVLAFTASGTLASSGALAANAIVIGGGAGAAPSTTTTGTGVVTAVGNAVNTTGGLVTQTGTLAANALLLGGGSGTAISSTSTGTGVVTAAGNAVNTTGGLVTQSGTLTANNILLGGGAGTAISSSNLLATSAAVTTGTYIKALGYADTVTALGNTGTAQNIDATSGGVFTATLTGNCTFTLRYPVSSGASSFILILTNDATANRTVAFSGGTIKYPGGSVTRTTAANAVDIWFFMTPDGGTTYYVSIPMANLS